MSLIKTQSEIKKLEEGGKKLLQILNMLLAEVKPGTTGMQIAQRAHQLIVEAGGRPAFEGYGKPPYPYAVCVSVNQCVVHGIATDTSFKEGDIVSLDIGMEYKGMFTDMARTVPVGVVSDELKRLIAVTRESLDQAIAIVRPGVTTGEIGSVVQKHVEKNGFGVIRDFVGHGVGHAVHEEPPVPNFGEPGQGEILREGMVICIEPMVALAGWEVEIADNKWDAVTADGSAAAHFEDTIIVTGDGSVVVTR